MPKKPKADPTGVDLAVRDQLEVERQRTVDAIGKAAQFPVATAEQRDKLSGLVAKSAERVKELEAERTKVTKPLNEVLRTVNGWFKPVRDAHEAFQKAAKTRIQERLEELRAEQDEALAAIQEGGGEAPDEAFALAHTVVETPKGMTTKKTHRVVVDNPMEVPRFFLTPNMPMIEAEFRAGRSVAGCSWVEEEVLVRAVGRTRPRPEEG